MSDTDEGLFMPESEAGADGAGDPTPSAADLVSDIWDAATTPADGSSAGEVEKAAGHFFDPPVDYDEMNRGQAEGREKAIADGLDENTARLMYPDIDPANPDRIN
jgi:hypothetical protein